MPSLPETAYQDGMAFHPTGPDGVLTIGTFEDCRAASSSAARVGGRSCAKYSPGGPVQRTGPAHTAGVR